MRILSLLTLAFCACGDTTPNNGTDMATATDLAMGSSPDLTTNVDFATNSTDLAGGQQTLTVKNYLSWCNVTVNGGTASTAAIQMVTVSPGNIPVSAVALTGFQLGATPWHDTSGDTGSGDPGTRTGTGASQSASTTAVVTSAPKCVWVCCEFAGGGGCPTANQCP